jgi:hypothetical protein
MNQMMLFSGCLPDVPRMASCVSLDSVLRAFASGVSQLRIDVVLPEQEMERELDSLHARWSAQWSQLEIPDGLSFPGRALSFRIREADGEHFIYAIDMARNRLAAYIMMSRLIELDRRADRFLRSPHTKVAAAYRRMGIASTVYRWWLDSGRSLMSGARQSPAAYALWRSLARAHSSVYVSVAGKRVRALPSPLSAHARDDLETRLVLLGEGCTFETFGS